MENKNEKTVLFVDDENLVVDIVCNKLRNEGMTCSYAPAGQFALDMLAKGPTPDLVILDVVMPGMTGFDVLQKMKENPKTAHIPVLMFSNEKNPENIKKATDMGAQRFVEKVATDPTGLAKIIKETLNTPSAV